MKQTDVTVTFYLKKSEMNDEGHCPGHGETCCRQIFQ